MFVRIIVYSLIAIVLYHVFTKYVMVPESSCGCNIEDDDIRREALLARVENKKKEKGEMKVLLHDYVQDTMNTLGIKEIPS